MTPVVKSDHESICKGIFERHLIERYPSARLRWRRYPNGRYAPPDYRLKIGKLSFAVEITRFKDELDCNGKRIPLATAEQARIHQVNELERAAISSNILRGTYCIHFLRDWFREPTQCLSKSMKKQVFNYLEATRNVETAPTQRLRFDNKSICSISKANLHSARIYVGFSYAWWANSPEIINYVYRAFLHSLTEKASILRRRNIHKPWVLVFESAFAGATVSMYQKNNQTQLKDALKPFHSVFIVMDSNKSFMLKSRRNGWSEH